MIGLYPWLSEIYLKILSSYRKGKGRRVLIVFNKWDNGEDIFIYFIARWLICSQKDDLAYCNVCYDCKLMNSGNHPDYYFFEPKRFDDNFGVDSIRFFIESFQHYAQQNKVKVIFISCVENLTEQAINVLLKLLEESPKNTYFFLKFQKYIKILPDLLNRYFCLFLRSPKEEIGIQWLYKQGIKDSISAKCAMRLCNGSPIAAKNILQQEDYWRQRLNLFLKIKQSIISGNFLDILPFLNVNKDYIIQLYWLMSLLLDVLKWKRKIEFSLINLDQIDLISIISSYWSYLTVNKQLYQWFVLSCYFQKYLDIDKELLLTYRLLNWQKSIVESCLNSWSI